jgi:hypothetical protein
VVSTGAYWHCPATQVPAKVRSEVLLTQVDAGGVVQVTVAQDGSVVAARHTPSRHT